MAKRKGNQKPTKSLILSTRNSLYEEAVFLYEKTERKAQRWQVNLLEVIVIRELLALEKGEQVLHTAHRTTTSHSAWERLIKLLDKAKIKYTSLRASGREKVETKNGVKVGLYDFTRLDKLIISNHLQF